MDYECSYCRRVGGHYSICECGGTIDFVKECNWCGHKVHRFHPFCQNCGMSNFDAFKTHPYTSDGIDPDMIIIDPTTGLLLQSDSQWIAITNPDDYYLELKVNKDVALTLQEDGEEFYSKMLGKDYMGLVHIRTGDNHDSWLPSNTVSFAFLHRDLFKSPPQICVAMIAELALKRENHWKTVE